MDSFDDGDDDDLLASLISVEQSVSLQNNKEQDSGTVTVAPELNRQDKQTEVTGEESKSTGAHDGEKEEEERVGDGVVAVPESFPFPFTPYDIQQDFMRNLYTCLELGKIGIFESPTGTGKSLSLICGALKWLRDYQEKQRLEIESLSTARVCGKENEAGKDGQGEPDWIAEFAMKKEQEEKVAKIRAEQEHIQKREAKLREMQGSIPVGKKRKLKNLLEDEFDSLMTGASSDLKRACREELEALDKVEGEGGQDEELVLEDYHSDQEDERKDGEKRFEEEEQEHVTKIYYCSRTHSQLSQFVREVVKSPYDDIRVISLGSRQNMCINPVVRKLKSLTLMNDKCLDLQQKKSKKKPGCPHYKQELLHSFKDRAMLETLDIEQLVTLGRQTKACPYYGARYAVPLAEIVALPYNTLLHKSTREACGIRLAGSIVVIDEAHNLLETINNIHSVEITATQIFKAHSQLSQYEKKFRSRLKAKNLLYVRQILFVLSHLAAVLGGKVDFTTDSQRNEKPGVRLLTINNFLFEGQLDNFNLFKLLRYCRRSQISKKLHGFVEKYQDSEVNADEEPKSAVSGLTKFLQDIQASTQKESSAVSEACGKPDPQKSGYMSSPLMQIESFLEALTNADQDGRVVVNKLAKLGASSLKFLMLNPAVHFVSVLREARSVVVAGGTMQPVSEFKDQLFHAAGISPARVMEFACGHVVPGSQLLPMAVARGPSGQTLDLTYQNRDKPATLDELGRVLVNLCAVVPGGLVCFFPSYEYEARVYQHWEKTSVLDKIQAKKRVFREPRRSGLADQVLADYAECIKRCSSWPGS
ncbi:ATP-dependent DNA helicase DDX11, partial [Aplysia californica]|uniref:ATP-dependent DNA helicase DDX11 n=1 Tax=Aplysia californica TaxID=6500 RepID=A0ABM1A453_APLCA